MTFRFLLRRAFTFIVLFLGITIISFAIIHLAPGRPADALTELNPKVSLEVRERLTRLYGLDLPLHIQYIRWVKRCVRLDLGTSFSDGEPVLKKIAKTLPVTLLINTVSLALILILGIPLGIATALHTRRLGARLIDLLILVLFAVPTYWLALLAIDLVSVRWRLLPPFGLEGIDHAALPATAQLFDTIRHLALPITLSSLTGLAAITRYVRQNTLETLEQGFIYACRSRGLTSRTILMHHVFKSTLLPVITITGLSLPGLVGGSVLFESIFGIPGTGRLFYDAVLMRDYAVIMALLTLGAFLTLAGNGLADLGYALADPRIHREKS
jgi:peptide/nickel transport system permease protein